MTGKFRIIIFNNHHQITILQTLAKHVQLIKNGFLVKGF